MTEAGNGHFDQLTEGLSPEQRSEFFQALHEAGITTHDVELARLLRALQLYKTYYETIPASVQKAAAEIERLKQEIDRLSADARCSSEASGRMAGQVIRVNRLFERRNANSAQLADEVQRLGNAPGHVGVDPQIDPAAEYPAGRFGRSQRAVAPQLEFDLPEAECAHLQQ